MHAPVVSVQVPDQHVPCLEVVFFRSYEIRNRGDEYLAVRCDDDLLSGFLHASCEKVGEGFLECRVHVVLGLFDEERGTPACEENLRGKN